MINKRNGLREFGKFRLDTDRKLLWLGPEPVPLPLKAVDLLCVLVERSGEVVSKEEIWHEVWNDAFVEETNLTHNIYTLRKTFKDLGEPDLIKTVPRRGYRFTGTVNEIPGAEVVLERHALTRTTIEFPDDSGETQALVVKRKTPGLIGQVFSASRVLPIVGVGLVLLAGFFVFRSGSAPTKTASDIRSIAVLPVRSFSESQDNEELRIRITDALITRLGHLERTAVRPTSAILPFVKTDKTALEVGKQLQTDAVIDSRIQQEGDRLRVTVQLIRVNSGEQIWAEQFDGKINEILNLQDVISTKVGLLLTTDTSQVRTLAKRSTENSDAYEAYLNGRYYWTKRDEPDLRRAIECFNTAISLDPNFAEAYTGLADAKVLLFNYNIDVKPELIADAKRDLQHALELRPDSADALTTLGSIQMVYDWDWKAAEESLRAATIAEPNLSIAHMRYGSLLARTGRLSESLIESQRAVELDPLSIVGITNLGLVHFCRKDFSAADVQYNKALEIGDTVGAAHWLLSRSLWLQGKKDDALKELFRGIELDGNKALADKLAAKSRTSPPDDVIRELLFEWRNNPAGTNPPTLAYLAASIGDRDKAMYWVERAVIERHPWTTWLYSAPEYETLRDIPRFQQVLREMNFVE